MWYNCRKIQTARFEEEVNIMINKRKISRKILVLVLAITTMIAFTPAIAFMHDDQSTEGKVQSIQETPERQSVCRNQDQKNIEALPIRKIT